MARSEASRKADQAYRKRNANKGRLPGVLLTEAESQLLDEMAEIYGSKKAAIIEGLKSLKLRTGSK